jgi:hypothetical protein
MNGIYVNLCAVLTIGDIGNKIVVERPTIEQGSEASKYAVSLYSENDSVRSNYF